MRKRALQKGVVLLLVLSGMTSTFTSHGPASAQNDKTAELNARIERVENGLLAPALLKGVTPNRMRLADRMSVYRTPGVSIAVVNNGRIEWARGYGVLEVGNDKRVDAETLFQAASISKPLTAMAVLQLIEKGKLDLDEPLNKHLRSWKLPDSEFTSATQPTLRQVITHTAGLTVPGFLGYHDGVPLPTLLQILDGLKPANSAPIRAASASGGKFNYSGGGYVVLQQLLQDVTKESFESLLQKSILDKVGMTRSTFQQPLATSLWGNAAGGHLPDGKKMDGKGYVYPELGPAGLWTTPTDLARFLIEIQQSNVGKSNKLLTKEMTQKMLTVQVDNLGLGLFVEGASAASRFSFGGSNVGFKCWMIGYLNTGQGAVVMTNSENGAPLVNEILRSISAEYGWPDYRQRERVVAKVDPVVYDRYIGEYEIMPGFILKITKEGDKLMSQEGPRPKSELYPESESQFFHMDADATFTFIKDEKGQVVRADIQRGTRLFQAKRIK